MKCSVSCKYFELLDLGRDEPYWNVEPNCKIDKMESCYQEECKYFEISTK